MSNKVTEQESYFKFNNIIKMFGDFTALDSVSVSFQRGEVHALLGENGAGKSTLMNIACGLYKPDSGNMFINNQEVAITTPKDAHNLGIGMVHQHYKLVMPFTALENIQLENGHGDYETSLTNLRQRAEEVAEQLGFIVDLDKPVSQMSVSEQQRVEILKLLTADTQLLILDEPTAVLTDEEADKLFTTMRSLAKSGATVVFVTHKLREAFQYSDRITVMRAGKVIDTVKSDEIDGEALTTMIVGEKISGSIDNKVEKGSVKLKLKDVCYLNEHDMEVLKDLSFHVKAGEIYGIAGIGGNGQNELTLLLNGLNKPNHGEISFDEGVAPSKLSPGLVRDLGLVFVHADRAKYDLCNDVSIEENYAISSVIRGDFGSSIWVNKHEIRKQTQRAIKKFDVRGVRHVRQKTGLLSGGNAQKLVISREFSHAPSIVIAHSPCRGLDVRAAVAVHGYLNEIRKHGAAVLLISEDLDEILHLSDRIGVISRGHIVSEFGANASRTDIGKAMVGHA